MTTKENFNLTILELLKEGKSPIQISKQLNLSLPRLSYYLHKFKELGYVEKKGYGTWEVKIHSLSQLNFKSYSIRGHGFIWKVKLNKNIDWISHLKNSKYSLIGKEKFPRLFINDKKVWLGKKNIVIYENKSFYANNSINSRKYAVLSLLSVLWALEKELSVNLKPYVFKPSREHYGMIKNDLARQYNDKGEKLLIHDNLEGDWLWIDDSHSLAELETGGTKAVVRSKQVQDWWNDNKKQDFKVTPSFLLESINGITQNQLIFAKNMESHIKAIQDLSKGVSQLVDITKGIQIENKKLKQRRLSEWQ